MSTIENSRKISVLFVCIGNENRSQMAEALARMYGGSKLEVYSAGSDPSGCVNQKAIAVMKEVGYDLTTHTSKSLHDIPQRKYDYVITMGCHDDCQLIPACHFKQWNIPDPKNLSIEQYRTIRGMIERKVKSLLERI